ncbi:MAG TPA: 3-isopropylmalate dehydratase small subunit [Casimicrobiaceae bacterium]|nr:3-isopropylmalate dehydratase small subunit [Casimicrobiaceae bacterium]
MEPFKHLDAIAVPIARSNVDTDQIIPARYLQKPRADDFGAYLFRDLRFGADGTEIDSFVLNQPPYRSARIVVAERNFGCGSSREQAVWALHDYGIRAAIAPSFGDIFATNAAKNGLLPIVLPDATVTSTIDALQRKPGARIAVDLASQIVVTPDGVRHRFDVDPFVKHCLLEGLDEISYTLTLLDRIEKFESGYVS